MVINLPTQLDLARRVSQPNPVIQSPVVRQAVARGKWKVVADLLDPRPVAPVFRSATVQFPSWTGWELFYSTIEAQYVSPPWDEWYLISPAGIEYPVTVYQSGGINSVSDACWPPVSPQIIQSSNDSCVSFTVSPSTESLLLPNYASIEVVAIDALGRLVFSTVAANAPSPGNGQSVTVTVCPSSLSLNAPCSSVGGFVCGCTPP